MTKTFLAAVALASLALAPGVQAQSAKANSGKQAAQCFAMYKMASDSPANAAHQDELTKMQGLMNYAMQKNGVTQAQFTAWTDALMTQLGKTSNKARPKLMSGKVQACNAYAKTQYDAYMKEKAAAPAPAPTPATK